MHCIESLAIWERGREICDCIEAYLAAPDWSSVGASPDPPSPALEGPSPALPPGDAASWTTRRRLKGKGEERVEDTW